MLMKTNQKSPHSLLLSINMLHALYIGPITPLLQLASYHQKIANKKCDAVINKKPSCR